MVISGGIYNEDNEKIRLRNKDFSGLFDHFKSSLRPASTSNVFREKRLGNIKTLLNKNKNGSSLI